MIQRAHFASLTGSPLWGLSVEEVIQDWTSRGWEKTGEGRPDTPYGKGPYVYYFHTQSGRDILWIPSYGGIYNEDWELHDTSEKVFWIMWKSGVKVFLVGGTSGITDFREGEEAILPGDLVIPWSFRTSARHRGLPKTEFETFWPQVDVTMENPFCPDLSAILAKEAQKYVGEQGIRKVQTPDKVRVALVIPDSITFESDYDILMWRALNKMISELQPELPPVVTLHGDCINPVLARRLQMHEVYYHLVANYAQGLGNHDITATLYPLYLERFPKIALGLEYELLNEKLYIPDGNICNCKSGVHVAPSIFSKAMTGE